jgi:GNAT superfamily N-acetyltransferase
VRFVARRSADLWAVELLDRVCFPDDEPVFTGGERIWWTMWSIEKDPSESAIIVPAAFGGVSPLRGQGLAYLCRAGVEPEFRGQGLQKRLLRARIAWCKKNGLEPITDTTADNVASINNLIAVGFKAYVPEYRWALPNSVYWRLPL